MKKTSYFFLLFLVASNTLFAQLDQINYDKYISDSIMSVLKTGVYLTHEDFLNNNPTYTEFTIVQNSQRITNEFETSPDILVVYDNYSQTKKELNDFWGVYDGKILQLFKKNILFKVNYSGRYNLCWVVRIKQLEKKYNTPDISGPGKQFFNPRFINKKRIIDFKTNEWYEYDVEYLTLLMKRNCPYYYKQYLKEFDKKKKLSLYLRKINGLE